MTLSRRFTLDLINTILSPYINSVVPYYVIVAPLIVIVVPL